MRRSQTRPLLRRWHDCKAVQPLWGTVRQLLTKRNTQHSVTQQLPAGCMSQRLESHVHTRACSDFTCKN